MIIDCATCTARGEHCEHCVMPLIAPAAPSAAARFTVEEQQAVAVLVGSGLIERPADWGQLPHRVTGSRLAG